MTSDEAIKVLSSVPSRTPAYRWMKRRYRALAELFGDQEINWEQLRHAFARIGVCTKNGSPLTSEALRNAWWRVRRDAAAQTLTQPAVVIQNGPTVTLASKSDQGNESDPLAALKAEMNQRSGR